ncbi:MAG TPA: hypothetical protein VJH91_03410 [Candidatus Paceibacterota bacterium]
MRALIALLLAIFLAGAPAEAAKKQVVPKKAPACTVVKTPEADRVSTQSPGYHAVSVRLRIQLLDDEDAEEKAKHIYLVFGIYSSGAGIVHDRDGAILDVGVCHRGYLSDMKSFYPPGTVWLRMYMGVGQVFTTSYLLEGVIPLPRDVVAQRPLATTTLSSGTYIGRWKSEGDMPILEFEPVR